MWDTKYESLVADQHIFLLQLLCVVCALGHKNVRGLERRRWTSTIGGILLIVHLMGRDSWHHILTSILSILIIKAVGKEHCHKVNTIFQFSYACIHRLLDPEAKWNTQTHLQQHMLLLYQLVRTIGLSAEIHSSYSRAKSKGNVKDRDAEDDEEILDPNFMDMFHYTFSFIGSFTGPYIRYRTFDDYLKLPMSQAVFSTKYFQKRLFNSIFACYVHTAISAYFPLQLLQDDAFYTSSYVSKVLYGFVVLQSFRLWMFGGFVMAEAVCSAAGMGAYPVDCKSKCGHGPTRNYKRLRELTPEEAKTLEYDFETVNCIDLHVIYTTPWLKVYTDSWNKSIQYFFGQYFYGGFFNKLPSKSMNVFLTWMVCSIWHGLEAGYFTYCAIMALYTIAERKYYRAYLQTSGAVSQVFLCCIWMMNQLIYSHAVVCFLVLDPKTIWRYASSIYFTPYIFLAGFFLLSDPTLKFVTKIKTAFKGLKTNFKSNFRPSGKVR